MGKKKNAKAAEKTTAKKAVKETAIVKRQSEKSAKKPTSQKRRYYVAYGSNLNVAQMRYRCPGARVVGVSEIEDYQLMFKGSKTGSYLTIEPEKGAITPVAIWSVTEDDEKSLDRYEGYPAFYYKKEMVLPVKDMRTGKVRYLNTFVYIMHESRPFGIPYEYYVQTCAVGYHQFDFDVDFLVDAVEYSAKRVDNLYWERAI